VRRSGGLAERLNAAVLKMRPVEVFGIDLRLNLFEASSRTHGDPGHFGAG
jgi:hypothetical protein